jgi:predicted RNase H-like HicB family nuclease
MAKKCQKQKNARREFSAEARDCAIDLFAGSGGFFFGFRALAYLVSAMRYAVVIEKAGGNYSAYVPDLPGCVATGKTVKDTEREIREAVRFHIEGLREDGLPVPEPTSIADYIEA